MPIAVLGPGGVDGLVGDLLARFHEVPETMRSSMQRDAAGGREIDIEAIGGAIVRAAERGGVEVPVTSRLVADLRSRGGQQ